MRSFYTDVASRLRYPTVSDNGTDVPDFTADPEGEDIIGRLQYLSSTEDLTNRISTDTIARWLGDPDLDLRVTDRLVFGGFTFEPTGLPVPLRSPHGIAAHSDTPLRRVDG